MQNRLLLLPVSAVNARGSWLFALHEPDAQLKASLTCAGQLTPLLAVEEGGEYHLVDGLERHKLLKSADAQALVLLVEAPLETDRAALRLHANQAWRLTQQDPARLLPALRYFLQRMPADKVQQTLPGLLDLAPRSKTWRLLWQWCEAVNADSLWEVNLLEGRLPLACAPVLARMDQAMRHAIAPFFAELQWSVGGGREFLTLLFEAAAGQGRDLDDLIRQAGLLEILDAGLSPKDCMNRLLQAARSLRFPHKAALDKRFAELRNQLLQGAQWRLLPEQQYETDALYLQARVRSAEDAARLAAQLQDMAGSNVWEALGSVAHAGASGTDDKGKGA